MNNDEITLPLWSHTKKRYSFERDKNKNPQENPYINQQSLPH